MISVCNDMALVKKFMLLPEIYRYCAEFGTDKSDIEFTSDKKEIWLTDSLDDKNVGLINLHVMTGSMCMFHPYILRNYRAGYDDMIQDFFSWFDSNMPPEAIKLNAIIPTMFRGSIKAANTAGMKQEGIDRLSYRHKSGVYDRVLFGITREEING